MVLPLSLQGAMNRAWTARNNEQIIDRFVQLGEEFIKILGVLLHTRYLGLCRINSLPFSPHLAKYISEEMGRPSFGNWAEYTKNCSNMLKEMNDRFGNQCSNTIDSELSGNYRNQAKSILTEISALKLVRTTIPRKPKFIHLLDAFVNLRNEARHSVMTEDGLKPLLDTGVRELLSTLIREFFDANPVSFVVPISIHPEGIGCHIINGVDWMWAVREHSASEPPPLETCFIQYYDDEDIFLFQSPLIFYRKETNYCMIYLDDLGVRFQYIDSNGESHKIGGTVRTVEEAFGIESIEPVHILNDVITEQNTILEMIEKIAGPEMASTISRLDVDALIRNILGNLLLKELKNRWNESWNWKEWYTGLFYGYAQSRSQK